MRGPRADPILRETAGPVRGATCVDDELRDFGKMRGPIAFTANGADGSYRTNVRTERDA